MFLAVPRTKEVNTVESGTDTFGRKWEHIQ